MQPNQKMKTNDGLYQVCLFPMDRIYITQVSSPDSYSHCCGHPCDYIGTTAEYPYYAPCDLELFYIGSSDGNNRGYTSTEPVMTPMGVSYVTILCTHDNNPIHNTIGEIVLQGELLGHTGVSGQVTGDHLHLDQSNVANDPLVYYGITCASGNQCYALQKSQYPYDIFFANDTDIVETQGYTFINYNKNPTPTKSNFGWIYYLKPKRKVVY